MTTKHDTQAATLSTEDPVAKPTLTVDDASRDVLSALRHIGPTRLGHAYGCPSEHAGTCTCGTAELAVATAALRIAIVPPAA